MGFRRISIKLPWPPSVNHYYVRTTFGRAISKKGRAYRENVILIMRAAGVPTLKGQLSMWVTAFPPDKRKRDLDNILKAMLDAIQHGGGMADDNQIKILRLERGEVMREVGGMVAVCLEELE